MVSRQKDFRNFQPHKIDGFGVSRRLQQVWVGEGLFRGRPVVAKGSRKEADDGIANDGGS